MAVSDLFMDLLSFKWMTMTSIWISYHLSGNQWPLLLISRAILLPVLTIFAFIIKETGPYILFQRHLFLLLNSDVAALPVTVKIYRVSTQKQDSQ